ncbi:MAG: sugar phosphate nucleotidyltransferase [Candidatus Pacearchaeota archaeon]|nr:sugar phosphate nucleotidyltransferase [Candidatus Pacearchaeota archaeon]
MKCVIFCGGKGTRMGSSTEDLPKPLLNIGDEPILIKIMNHYASYGITNFILCLGFLGDKIRNYFKENPSKYNVEMISTGVDATKSERLLAVKEFLDTEDSFFVSYGDDLSNVDILELRKFHEKEGKLITLTAVKLPNPYGVLDFDDVDPRVVSAFKEKPIMNEWINGGYFVFDKRVFEYLEKGSDLEEGVFNTLSEKKEIAGFRHKGFWKSMNTLKDYVELNEMFKKGELNCLFREGKEE